MADTQINVGMNVDGVITGTDKAKRKISELGGAARDAGRGTGAIGDGMAATSQKVELATRNMIASIQRQTAALESGSKASRKYQESLARSRGIDTAALRPYLDQLDSVREKQERAAQSAEVMKSAGVAAGVAAAGVAAALAASVKSAIDTADQFSKMAAKTGVAVEALRELNYAASLSDVSTEALGSNMQKLSLNMAKAAGGSKEQAEVFKAMGVSVKDASGQLKNAGSFVEELAGKFANYADGPEKAALAMQIFGESGAAMIPLLNSGAQGLKDMAKEANELGTVFSGDMAKQAEAFNDSLTRIQTLTQGAGIAIATELLPTLNLLTKTFLESAKEGKGFGADLASGARVAVEAFVVLYSDVEFVLKAIGREIGAIAAQLVALGKLDFAGFTAISDAVKEDGVRARAELDKFQRDVLNARFQTSTAGAGRGTAADPRILGDIPSLQTAAPVINKTTAAVKALGDAFVSQRAAAAEWAKYVGEFAKYAAEADAKALGLTKTQAKLVEYLGSTAYTEMAEPARQLALEAAYAAIATEQLTEATKAQLKAMDDAHKAATAYAASLDKIALADADVVEMASAYADSVAERVRATEFEAGLIGQSNTQRAVALKQYQIEMDLQKQILSIKQKMASGDEQAKAIAAVTAAAQKSKANAAAEVVNAEFERVSQQIEQSLTDALMRGFESGKGFAEVLRDTVVNMFKTMVLRPIVSAVVSPVAGAITGAMGFSGAANAATGGLSALGAIGGTGNLLGSLGASATYGTSLISQQGAMLAAQEAGMGTLAGGASSLGAALPWIGGAMALVSLISSLDDSGTMHTGGAALADSINGVREIEAATIGFGIAAADVSSQIVGSSKQMASSALGLLQGLDGLTGGKNKFSVATGFADDSSKDGAWGSLAISKNGTSLVNWADTQTSRWAPKEFADGEAGAKQYGDAVAAGIKQAIDTLDLPDWAGNIVAKLGDAPSMDSLNAAVQTIMAMPEQMLQAIGTSSQALAGTIYTGMQASDPMGAGKAVADQITYGIEASLYQGFAGQVTGIISTQLVTPVLSAMQAGATLTEAMASASIDTMRAQVAAAGAAFAAIVSDPGFKASLASINTLIAEAVGGAVDGYTAPTAPAAYAPPSPIAPVVASTVSGAGSVADAVTDLAKVFADAKDSLLETGRSLSADLLRAQGDEAGALAAERAIYLAGFSQLGQAERDRLASLYDQNQAVRDQITAAEKINALTDEAKNLNVQLLQVRGDEAGALALLTASMGDAERAAYMVNEALRDQIKAVGEQTSLERQLLELNKDTAGMHALQLAALEPANRALQEQVWALQDLAEAAEKAKEITKELAQSLPQVAAKYLTPEQNTANGYRGIAQGLVDSKVSGLSVDDLTTGLTSATKEQFIGVAAAIYNAAGTTDAMRLAILKAANAFADLKTAAEEEAKEAAKAAAEKIKAIADERYGLEAKLLQLQGNTVALRERELAALDPSNRALQARIYALQDEAALIGARADTAGKYQAVVSAEKQARDGITAGYLQAADALQAINERAANSLRDLAKNLRDFVQGIDASEAGGLGPAERLAAAQANFAIAKAQAMAGDTGAQGKLTGLASSVLDLSLQTAASKVDYLRTVGLLKADLNAAATAADAQAGAATPVEDELLAAQKEVAKWSAAAAESGAATTKAVTDYAEEWRKANADLATANKALSDVGISALALNVKQPITELIESIGALSKQMALTASTNPGSSTVAELTGAIASGTSTGGISGTGSAGSAMERASVGSLRELWSLGQSLVSSATDYTNAQIQSDPVLRAAFGMGVGNATGQTASLYAAMKADDPAYNDLGWWLDKNVDKTTGLVPIGNGGYVRLYDPTKLPAFDVGTNFVPRDMIAQVHQGEMIVPAAYNPATSGLGNAEMVAEIRALRSEVAELRKSNTAENAAIAGTSLRTAKVLERVTPDGDAIAIRTAEAIA